jgi:hypothetical protein
MEAGMQPPQHTPPGLEPQDLPLAPLAGQPMPAATSGEASVPSTAAEQELSKATQVLVESSNRALRQSSEKLSLLEAQLSELRTSLEAVNTDLAAEREQRIVAEAQLELVKRLETGFDTALSCTNQQPPAHTIYQPVRLIALSVFLPALVGAALGGGVALLGLQILWPSRKASPPAQPATAQLSSLKPVDAGTKPPPPARKDTLHLRCDQPCWLDVRDIPSNRVLVSRNLKGRLSLQIGTGLDVFTARGYLLKIRINDGPETRFSKRLAGKRTFLPPKT